MDVQRNPHTFHRDIDLGGNFMLDEQGLQDRIATSYYRMDGNGDYAALADDAKQDVGINDFGLSVRFKPDNVTTARQVLQNKESGGIGYGLEIREDDLWIRLDDGTVDVTAKIATAVISNDVWFHYLVRFDRSGNATAYVNGVKVGTVDISTAGLTLSNAGAYRVGTESGGTTLEFTGQISHNRFFNYLPSEVDAKSYSQGGAVDYSDIGATNTELMPNQVDRDFSGASAWTNVDIDAYDETTDLTITANAANQYAEIAVASAPMTQGKRYRWYYDAANIVSTWVIKDFTGVQTFGTISANATQGFIEFIVDSGITGGFRIVSGSATSSIDFDNFSLFDAGVVSDYRPVSITAGTWYDLSGNDLDLTITNAIAVGVSETIITAEEIVFTGGTGDNKISIPDNLADALSVVEAANKYQTFVTTNGSESVDFLKQVNFAMPTLTSGGTGDYGAKLTQILNDSGAAGGSDLYTGFLMDITETDVTGWDSVLLIDLQVGSSTLFSVTDGGIVFVGNETINTNMTTGITINQGGADNEIFVGKSSDVGHPFTAVIELDSYIGIEKWAGDNGGVVFRGFSDADKPAMGIFGYVGNASPTMAPIVLRGHKTDGATGAAALADAEILLDIHNSTTPKIRILGDGTLEFQQASSITSGGNNLIKVVGGTAGVRLNDGIGIDSTPAPTAAGIVMSRSVSSGAALYSGISYTETVTVASTQSYNALLIDPVGVVAFNTGTHVLFTGINIGNFTVTESTDSTITSLVGLYIEDAPQYSGAGGDITNLLAMWVVAGVSRFGGTVDIQNELTLGNDAANISGKINFIASDGDAADIAINTSDQLTFNNAVGGYLFDATIEMSGTANSPKILSASGSAATPNIIPDKADPDTGLFTLSADRLGLAVGGFQMLLIRESTNNDNLAAFIFDAPDLVSVTSANGSTWRLLQTQAVNVDWDGGVTITALHGQSAYFDIITNTADQATTASIASTVYIAGAPVDGSNVTITTMAALYVNAGVSIFNDVIHMLEITTPTSIDSYGAIYPKADNELYFKDGAGVEHVILKGAAATRDLFFQPIEAPTGVVGDWEVHEINASQEVHFIFHIPANFTTLVSANIVMIPDATETIQWDANISVAANGEGSAADARSVADDTLAVTSGNVTEVDISDELTGLAAEDYVAVNFQADTANLRIIGIEIEYE